MDCVFSTDEYAPEMRYSAWRDAGCDVHVNVEVAATDPDRSRGFIKTKACCDMVLTDVFLSAQWISRRKQHLSRLGKDCDFVQLSHCGAALPSSSHFFAQLRQGFAMSSRDILCRNQPSKAVHPIDRRLQRPVRYRQDSPLSDPCDPACRGGRCKPGEEPRCRLMSNRGDLAWQTRCGFVLDLQSCIIMRVMPA